MNMKHTVAIAALAAAALAGCRCGKCRSGAEVTGLTVNHLVSPANIDGTPSFGWRMCSARTGAAQTAYRLKVFEGCPKAGSPVWDSGEVECGKSVGVRYAGPALKSASRYVWQVAVKDENGVWLAPATAAFETGLLAKDDWNGSKWISAADSRVAADPAKTGADAARHDAEDGTSCFVKTVANGKELKSAWWTVAGLGVFEAYVNGKPVSRKTCCGLRRDFLKPGFTHCAKTKYAFTYDVTHLVKTGADEANAFAAQVSAGWWRDKIVNFFGKKSAFRAQLILRYADGTELRVGTDESWLSAVGGPVLRAAIFDGEDYDARIKNNWMFGVAKDGFKVSVQNDEFSGELLPMVGAPVTVRDDLALAPAEMFVWKGVDGADDKNHGTVRKLRSYVGDLPVELAEGESLIVDFAQNAAAVPEFTFAAAAGTILTMTPAEMLNDGNGAKSRGCDGPEGTPYRANYRLARSTLNYTFAGEGDETYRPQFTFFGYRYLSISATGPVAIRRIRSVPVTSVAAGSETGCLDTGIADVNKLVSNALWGQYSNYLSVPTDCPQRNERLGWTADTQVFAEAGTYNADVYGFFLKWMRDMRDSQHADGSFPGVAPKAQYGDNPHQLGWADAGVIVPYVMWQHSGDTRIVEENWDAMVRYVALVDSMKFDSPQARGHQWADWLSYEKLESWSRAAYEKGPDGKQTVKPDAQLYWQYLGCCYWRWDAMMMAEMADALGKGDEARAYREMAARAKDFLRGKFVDANDGMLIPLFRDMQTPALFALKLGLLDADAAASTRAALLKNIKDHGDCLQTGFLGTSILMDTLTYTAQAPDVAYTLLLQHKNPSWLYTVDQGATTFWERWNSYTKADGFASSGMNSFNHYAYGAVLAWLYGSMAGIQEDPAEPGFKHIILAPVPDRRMGHVTAVYRSPYGNVASAWRYDGERWTWSYTIPANTTATVIVPGEMPVERPAGTYTVERLAAAER